MKKKNGFVFVETMIVLVTLLTILLAIYSAYVSLIRSERIRVRYDEPAFIYKTYAVGKFLNSLYDDEGNSIIRNKIRENLAIREDVLYVNITPNDVELFSDSYGNNNESRQDFFSQMYSNMNIQNIILLSRRSIGKIKNESSSALPKNLTKYIETIDLKNKNNDKKYFFLVIEYAEKVNGTKCSPNQLLNVSSGKVESSCTFYYSYLPINDGGEIYEQ